MPSVKKQDQIQEILTKATTQNRFGSSARSNVKQLWTSQHRFFFLFQTRAEKKLHRENTEHLSRKIRLSIRQNHPNLQIGNSRCGSWFGVDAYCTGGAAVRLLPDELAAELPVAPPPEVPGDVEVELLNPDAAWFKLARAAASPTHTASHKREQHH